MDKEKIINIEELIQDDKNFNSGTEEGRKLMEKSFNEFGAGRSILIDKNNRIIAGNKSQEAAIDAGISKVRVIETTGDELIAVKRIDVDLDSETGRKMALADNATQAANLSWDEMQLQSVADEIEGFDYHAWGIDEISEGISDDEISQFFSHIENASHNKMMRITVVIPTEYSNSIDEIKQSIQSSIYKYKGCKVL